MSSELKPLYANLRRAGISKYIVNEAFENLLIELNLDDEWKEYKEEFEISSTNDVKGYEEAFFKMLQNVDNNFFLNKESNILKIVLDFLEWNERPIDYTKIQASLNELNFVDNAIEYFDRKAGKINGKKNFNQTIPEPTTKRDVSKVFIIHGHDKPALLELEKLIKEEFNLVPVIIQQSPNEGLDTIITKFERHANECALAVVLLTPDDRTSENAFRARQNVILEFGYFMGRDQGLNRRIIVLKKGNVEIPSDINGVLYMDFHESVNEVHLQLRKQLLHWKLIKG